MNRKNNRRKALWIILFVLIVGLSGFALAANGSFENPLAAFIGGGQGGERGERPQMTGGETSERPPQGEMGERGGEQGGFSLSQIGSVLYNVWYLFAIAAVVIVVQTLGGGLIQRVKRRVSRAAST
ncbi:MAG: hypothetical protein LCI00_14240 [Chloroflexi bacterium]|nr:hypothetical protein [Chloroflexota bacterium]MCC6895073.1 hypothetical protein [Anaerolineae bacterium]